jgi:hypothetical protein
MSDQYIAGVCNIGKAEVRQRMIVSIAGLVLALGTATWLVITDAPTTARWGVFLPLMVWSIGLVQARNKFCIAFGLAGTFNFGRLGSTSKIIDPEFRKADQRTVLKIAALSITYAFAATLGFVLLPV